MSEPSTNYNNKLAGAASEMLSATSSLNMGPDPIPKDKLKGDEEFLSELDHWAKHSLEHMHAAINLVSQARQDHDLLILNVMSLLNVCFDKQEPLELIGSDCTEWAIKTLSEVIKEQIEREL